MSLETYDKIVTTATVIGALGCWYFVVAYWILTHGAWRRSGVGQHLMSFTALLGSLFTIILVNRVLGTYLGRKEITVVLFVLFVIQVIVRCVLLHYEQRKVR